MKTVKGKPITTAIGEIIPTLGEKGDKLKDGREINSGSMFMQMAGGTATVEHEGKKVEIKFGTSVAGATIILSAPGGRKFVTDLEKIINHAIDNGLLDADLRFEEETNGRD